jgi:hypothetical protein
MEELEAAFVIQKQLFEYAQSRFGVPDPARRVPLSFCMNQLVQV